MKEIFLNKEKVVLVDDDDYEYLNQWKWNYTSGYAKRKQHIPSSRKNQKSINIYMHRLINNTPEGFHTDHINGNKLDNRKENLRTVTSRQNQGNRFKTKPITSSKYKGVWWDKRSKKWCASICINYRNKYLGSYKSEIDAAKIYNDEAIKVFGKYAKINSLNENF